MTESTTEFSRGGGGRELTTKEREGTFWVMEILWVLSKMTGYTFFKTQRTFKIGALKYMFMFKFTYD